MIKKVLFFFLLAFVSSCDTREITQSGIEYTPLLGNYQGNCATFVNDPIELPDPRSGNIRLFGVDQNTIGIDASCFYIEDVEMMLSFANAERIVLSRGAVGSDYSELTYFAKEDSIVLINFSLDPTIANTIFFGLRD